MTDIKLENCKIITHNKFASGQRILTLRSQKIPQITKAGQFVHLNVSKSLAMRRPISIMSVDVINNTFDLLYKITGLGTKILAERQIGEYLSVLGPIGNGFKLSNKKNPLLIGGGVGIPPIIAMAQTIKKKDDYDPFVILGSEIPFPFILQPSNIGKYCKEASHTMPLLEQWGIKCRLTSLQKYKGVYNGYVTDLAEKYLNSLNSDELQQIEIYSCGPHTMLAAVAKLAKNYNLPAQIALEEYMACGVGGCAGCTVKIKKNNQQSMQRVCVDGPVFMSDTVFYD